MAYIRFPIETSPQQLANDVFDYIKTYAPDWTPSDGDLATWIIRAMAAKAAESRDLASDVQDDIFRSFGASLMSVPPLPSSPATGHSTWTLSDVLGHTIPANTAVALQNDAGDSVVFYTVSSIIVPAGSSVTAAGDVLIRALLPGVDGNNLGGAGIAVQLVDSLPFVDSIVMTDSTSGGVDEESDADYLNRLVRVLRRLSRRPIIPQDFADAALDVSVEVQRAVALDLYDPDTDTWDNARTVTIAAVDVNGDDVSAPTKTALAAYYEANRETNFVVNIMSPNYTDIEVDTTIVVVSGYDPATAAANVVTAVENYLDPANWGQDPNLQSNVANDTWIEQDTLYYNEMITLISNVEGVDRVSTMTMNEHGSAPGTADVTLNAPAALTRPYPSGITVTTI